MNAKEKLNSLLSELLSAHREYLEAVEYGDDKQEILDAAGWVGETMSGIKALLDEVSDSYDRMSKERDRLGGLADERAEVIETLRDDVKQANKSINHWVEKSEAEKLRANKSEEKLNRVRALTLDIESRRMVTSLDIREALGEVV